MAWCSRWRWNPGCSRTSWPSWPTRRSDSQGPPHRVCCRCGSVRSGSGGGPDLDRAGLPEGGPVAAVGLLQAVVDHRVELAVFAVLGLAAAREFEQPGHGLVLGVVV